MLHFLFTYTLMQILATHIHPSIVSITGIIKKRTAARGIIIKNNKILLLYTQRYNDYSLPGGGIDEGENPTEGLARELSEETGACNVCVEAEFGIYEEFRPALKPDHDILHMISYIYKVDCDDLFEAPSLEDYELKNGMKTQWMDIDDAITHNEKVIVAMEASKGLSIERELFLLHRIREEYFATV
jgi:8-oxo-dGTP pyrophosphatase MutT (NUDIX family)